MYSLKFHQKYFLWFYIQLKCCNRQLLGTGKIFKEIMFLSVEFTSSPKAFSAMAIKLALYFHIIVWQFKLGLLEGFYRPDFSFNPSNKDAKI